MERLDRAQGALRDLASLVTRHSTRGPKTAGAIARECVAAGSDLIVAAGGDGTINEVADGLIGSPIPLGILPAGTANVLARELRLGRSMEQAARNLANCEPRLVSMGKLRFHNGTSQHFLLMAGAGLDAHIILNLDAAVKTRFGKAAYWLGGFQQLGRKLQEFEVETDGIRRTCSFALISKVRNYGGDFEIAREVRLMDNQFEVVLFEGVNSFRYIVYLAGVATNRLRMLPGVTIYRATDVKLLPIDSAAVHLQVDGEYAGELPATISAEPDSLMLLIPQRYLAA
jgi:diacylglycerol kinase (ATP)